jgi:hypothetical protein
MAVDGDNHARLQGSVRTVFTPSFVAEICTGTDATAGDAIQNLSVGESFGFMADIAVPPPIGVAGE